jgi:hypothetical protein
LFNGAKKAKAGSAKEKYGPPKHYTEEAVIHEDDPYLE